MSPIAAQLTLEAEARGLPGKGGPAAIVHTPESLLLDPTVSRESKRVALRSWLGSIDGGDPEMRTRVFCALRVLER